MKCLTDLLNDVAVHIANTKKVVDRTASATQEQDEAIATLMLQNAELKTQLQEQQDSQDEMLATLMLQQAEAQAEQSETLATLLLATVE